MIAAQDRNDALLRAGQVYWDFAAESYEAVFSGTTIGRTRREAVWRNLERLFERGERVLEINCGTGLDAVFLARKEVKLVACDISPEMIEKARRHAEEHRVSDRIEFLPLATEALEELAEEPLFDGAFSNFSGLNCVENLAAVRTQLAARVKPGSPLLLCMIGRFALWEVIWFLLHGRPRLAFQRLREETANVGRSEELKIYRPSVKKICSEFSPDFQLLRWSGVGITVPPSYMEHWARRFPRTIDFFARVDKKIGELPVFRSLADCVVLEFERVSER